MQIKIGLSEQYRDAEKERQRQRFVADGTPIGGAVYTVTLDVPVADLAPASREALLPASYGGELRVPTAGQSGDLFELDTMPSTPAEWDVMLAQFAAAHAAGQAAHDMWCVEQDQIRLERAAADTRLDEQRQRAGEREEAEKAARKQERDQWIQEHGSDHLRAAVDAGYNCQRLYIMERAAREHPGYAVDFDEKAEYKSRSCPSSTALAEHLRVEPTLQADETVNVVWLTHGVETDDESDYDPEPYKAREAVVIENWLGKYNLVRTDFASAEDPSDCADLPGGYQRLGRILRHSDAVMLLDGHTDNREIMAYHTLLSGSVPEGCPETGAIPPEMQKEMSATGIEGVWFARIFPTIAAAEEFAARRLALSARRTRDG